MQRRLALPQVVEKFANYYQRPGNGAWGELHVVLDDGNVSDDDVAWVEKSVRDKLNSSEYWLTRGPDHGHDMMYALMLCHYLRRLTRTQRLKLPHAVDRYVARAKQPGVFRWRHTPAQRRQDGRWRDGEVKFTCVTCHQGRAMRYSAYYLMVAIGTRALLRVAENAMFALKYGGGCPHISDGKDVPIPDFTGAR